MIKRYHIALDEATGLKIDALALQEERALSNMTRILIKESLKNRQIPDQYLNKERLSVLEARGEEVIRGYAPKRSLR